MLSRFATRLNSFASAPHLQWPGLVGKPSMMQMAERAATVSGLTDVDLNFPDHVSQEPASIARRMGDLGLSINGLAMRLVGFRRGHDPVAIPSIPVRLVSTHGAGDVFAGTFAAALAAGKAFADCLHLANRAAAKHVST